MPSNSALHEQYTGWAKSAQLVVFEEVMARGRLDLMNKLKPMITQPTISIRQMYSPEYEQPNRMNILMFTNYDDAIVIDDDRRYCILCSPSTLLDEEYYKTLWSWTKDKNTPEKLAYFLMNRDLSKFNPNAKAPLTDARKELLTSSRTRLEEYVEEHMKAKIWPFKSDIFSITHIMLENVCPPHLRNYSVKHWSNALKKYGAVKCEKQIPMSDDSIVRVWFIRRHELYEELSAKQIATKYEKWLSFQNGFGVFQRMNYGCIYDTANKTLLDVIIEPIE